MFEFMENIWNYENPFVVPYFSLVYPVEIQIWDSFGISFIGTLMFNPSVYRVYKLLDHYQNHYDSFVDLTLPILFLFTSIIIYL